MTHAVYYFKVCVKVTPTRVFGTNQYTLESSVCQAAIHDGRTTAHNGGSVTMKFIAGQEKYTGSSQHGITSDDADAAEKSMIFESDFLGCEAGWSKYRDSCYYIPANAAQNSKTWAQSQGICESMGGHLATVGDRAESDYLFGIIRANHDMEFMWIGLTDDDHPDWYEKWVDDTPVTFLRSGI